MKVVGISNYNLESVAETLIASDLSDDDCKEICKNMNKYAGEGNTYYYVVKPDDYVLWRGMEDLV